MLDWKGKAEELFFIAHIKIVDIADQLGISRQAVAGHLKGCDGFEEEKQRRKDENAESRKAYQAEWDRANRNRGYSWEADLLKRQHEIDVKVLSYERYF